MDRDIDTDYFLKFPNLLVYPWEACAVSVDIDPDSMSLERNDYSVGPGALAMYGPQPSELKVQTLAKFKKRETLLTRYIDDPTFFSVIDGKLFLPQFVNWLRSMGVEHIPLALTELQPNAEDQAKLDEVNAWLDENPDVERRPSNGSAAEIQKLVQAAADSVASRLRAQSGGRVSNEPRIQVSQQQEDAIVCEIKARNIDPVKFPVNPPGKAGHKAEIRSHLCKTLRRLFVSEKTFDTAWERLRDTNKIIDAPTTPP